MTAEEILARVEELRAAAKAKAEEVSDAKDRKARVETKIESLFERFSERVEGFDWDHLEDVIATATKKAEKAIQRLERALQKME